jgi:Ala-tRNA(Pro) deacylase
MENVVNFLKTNGIEYRLYEHPAVYTCEEAERYRTNPDCMDCKNLFLKDKKSPRFFLVILPANKKADLKSIAETIGEGVKITFANEVELKEKLGLEAGAVSLFGLLNNKNKDVELYIDNEILGASKVGFHPNVNTATIELSKEAFHKLLEVLGYKVNMLS